MEPIPISIIIPCRNEEKFIGRCLDSVISNDYPKDKLEILVVDGMSEDNTRAIVEKYKQRHPFIKLLENPKKNIPAAINIGVQNAKNGVIIRIGAHAIYPKNYISNCIKYLNLKEYDADVVGGRLITLPDRNTIFGKAIVYALSTPFGVGNAYFRIGAKKPVWADTVFGGCCKRELFDKVGPHDENIARSEDVDFNSRLRRMGGKILLVPEIVSYYYARSDFKDFIKHNFDNGLWITYPLKFGKVLFSFRHIIPLIFVLSLLSLGALSIFFPVFRWILLYLISSYLFLSFYFSFKIAKKENDLRYIFLMPLIFVTLHIVYGLGSILGLVKISERDKIEK